MQSDLKALLKRRLETLEEADAELATLLAKEAKQRSSATRTAATALSAATVQSPPEAGSGEGASPRMADVAQYSCGSGSLSQAAEDLTPVPSYSAAPSQAQHDDESLSQTQLQPDSQGAAVHEGELVVHDEWVRQAQRGAVDEVFEKELALLLPPSTVRNSTACVIVLLCVITYSSRLERYGLQSLYGLGNEFVPWPAGLP